MCFFSTTETRDVRHGVLDPPRHRSRYSAHPPPGVVRIPVARGSTHSYREYDTRRSTELVDYRRSQPRIEYVTPRSSRPEVDHYRKSVTYVRD